MNPESSQSFSEGFFLEINAIYDQYNQENELLFQKFSHDITGSIEKLFDILRMIDMEGKNSDNVVQGVRELMTYVNAMEERMNYALEQPFEQPENQ